jgi:carbon storage regulator
MSTRLASVRLRTGGALGPLVAAHKRASFPPVVMLAEAVVLVLSRFVSQSILIGRSVRVCILSVKRNQVRLGIEAPDAIAVHREEVFARIENAENMQRRPAKKHST